MNKLFKSSKADHLQGALNVTRRGFLVTTSTLGAGLALGMTTRPAASSSMRLCICALGAATRTHGASGSHAEGVCGA